MTRRVVLGTVALALLCGGCDDGRSRVASQRYEDVDKAAAFILACAERCPITSAHENGDVAAWIESCRTTAFELYGRYERRRIYAEP